MNLLKEPMQQVWKQDDTGWYDQYGFEIKRKGKFFLYKGKRLLIDTHSLEAAKEISLVLINDRIMNA